MIECEYNLKTVDQHTVIEEQCMGHENPADDYIIYRDLKSGERWIIYGRCDHGAKHGFAYCLTGAVNPLLDEYVEGRWIRNRLDVPTRPEVANYMDGSPRPKSCDCGLRGEYLQNISENK